MKPGQSENKVLGEIRLSYLDLQRSGRQNFASGPYEYYYYHANKDVVLDLNELESLTLFVLDTASGITVSFAGTENAGLKTFDALQSERIPVKVSAPGGAIFIVAGMKTAHPDVETGVTVLSEENQYRVSKPWGYEIWVNGRAHPGYCLKKIFIERGMKTSLQYHCFKQETNLIYQGEAVLHYKKNAMMANDEVTDADIGQEPTNSVTAIDVSPNTLHRIESRTDILLYEVSTPYLDDVIRVHDDSNRSDGRITTEHQDNG